MPVAVAAVQSVAVIVVVHGGALVDVVVIVRAGVGVQVTVAVLVRMGVRMRMGVHQIAVAMLVDVHVGMRMTVTMFVGMGVRLGVLVAVGVSAGPFFVHRRLLASPSGMPQCIPPITFLTTASPASTVILT